MCEQEYHSVVACALGWACWKTNLGRAGTPEADWSRDAAMGLLGNGLSRAGHDEDALSVREAELAMNRRLGASEEWMLYAQNNLANTYERVGRVEAALRMRQDVYTGRVKLYGEEHGETLQCALNYASSLIGIKRIEEARSLLRKTMPVARCVLGEGNTMMLQMRSLYAQAPLYLGDGATLGDLRESVTIYEENARTARRVLGGAHPLTAGIEKDLQIARAALRTCEKKAEKSAEEVD